MSNLANKPPLGQKAGKAPRKRKRRPLPAYIAAMHLLPCAACQAAGLKQRGPTEAHHCFSGRGSSVRAPDEDAIPLCQDHHQGGRGSTRIAIHLDKAGWEAKYGPDTGFIAATRRQLAEHLPKDLRP